MSDATEESWHLDKKVPIAFIVAILIQTGGIVYWAATQSARITTLEQRFQTLAGDHDRIVRIEGQVEGLREDMTELKIILRGRFTQP